MAAQAKRKKDIIGHYITTKGDNIYQEVIRYAPTRSKEGKEKRS